jgi:hypothetical protein
MAINNLVDYLYELQIKMEVQMKKGTTLSLLVALALLISACNFPFVDTESAVADSVAQTVAAMEAEKAAEEVVPTLAPLPTQVPTESEDESEDEYSGDRCDAYDEDCYHCDPYDDDCIRCDSWDDDNCDRCQPGDDYCYRFDDDYWDQKGGWDKNRKHGKECLYATFLGETVKDNTTFVAGDAFTKTWTLRNDGYCTWNEDYQLVFKSGNQMGGPDEINFGGEIDPGEQIILSLDLVAPADAGTYLGYWQIMTDDDVKFGSALSVKIKVE